MTVELDSTGSGGVDIAKGGTNATTESGARTNLGLEIGTDVQAYDANLPTWPATVDATEVGYLNGVTSAIQTQLDAKAAAALTTASYSSAQTLTSAQCLGGVIYVTAAATITLPAIAVGMSVTIIADAAATVTIDPNGTEVIRLDGVDASAGATIASTGTIGDIAVLTYHSSGKWYASTNSWT